MKSIHGKWFSFSFFLLLISVLGVSYTVSAKTTASIEAGWQSMQSIPARMLLLMPQEFAGYVFIYTDQGEEIRLPLGEQGVNQLKLLLQSAFTSMEVLPVPSKSAALDMLSHGDPRLRGHDLVAIPKFEDVSYWNTGAEFGFSVDISLEMAPLRSRMMDTITGHGETSAPQGVFSPIEKLTLAVSYSLDAIAEVIESRREVWSP